jgi:hemerythrin-like domain-containing protein
VNSARREWLAGVSSLGFGAILVGCNRAAKFNSNVAENKKENEKEEDVPATEDLMREHGVLRRVLLVYYETALTLRTNPAVVVKTEPLQRAAKLFRAFGEEYHEKKLKEAYIFPAIKEAGGPAAGYADVFIAQHQRGREITDYIISVTAGAKLGAGSVDAFAAGLNSLVRMYEHHAAIEETIVFPAWKDALGENQMDEMNEKFGEIEHQQFGEDGFEDAVRQIAEIEQTLGLGDLAQFTAPPPPASG